MFLLEIRNFKLKSDGHEQHAVATKIYQKYLSPDSEQDEIGLAFSLASIMAPTVCEAIEAQLSDHAVEISNFEPVVNSGANLLALSPRGGGAVPKTSAPTLPYTLFDTAEETVRSEAIAQYPLFVKSEQYANLLSETHDALPSVDLTAEEVYSRQNKAIYFTLLSTFLSLFLFFFLLLFNAPMYP